MELKEGLYVRTEKGIAKIIDRILEPDHYYFKMWVTDNYLEINDDTEYISEVDVLKASNNIIDLIEEGDIITTNNVVGEITTIEKEIDRIYLACFDYDVVSSQDIKSIVTKEQFKSMEYKVN